MDLTTGDLKPLDDRVLIVNLRKDMIKAVKRRKYRSKFYWFPQPQIYYQIRIADVRGNFTYGGTVHSHDLGW